MLNSYTLSGILYNHPTKQLLLNQIQNNNQIYWTVVEDKGGNSDSLGLFRKLVSKNYGFVIEEKNTFLVYDYINKNSNNRHYVYYGLINNINQVKPQNNMITSWFTFRQLSRLKFLPQIHHDIVITQRVINSHYPEVQLLRKDKISQ